MEKGGTMKAEYSHNMSLIFHSNLFSSLFSSLKQSDLLLECLLEYICHNILI